MHLAARQEFPADPDAVYRMVTDEEFLRHAAVAMGATGARVSASSTRSAVEATVATLPVVAAFIGATMTITQEVTWADPGPDGSRTGEFSLSVAGAPVTFGGTARVAPAASGSEVTYDGELTVHVPMLGAHIEQQVAPTILEALEAQARVGRDWLAR